jgi:hypothetical protein
MASRSAFKSTGASRVSSINRSKMKSRGARIGRQRRRRQHELVLVALDQRRLEAGVHAVLLVELAVVVDHAVKRLDGVGHVVASHAEK